MTAEVIHPPKPRRRWLQFSLRTLLLLVLLSALGTWLAVVLRGHYHAGLREKESIAWVEGLGGEVTYDEGATANDWRRQWLGDWYPPVVVGVDMTPQEVDRGIPSSYQKTLVTLADLNAFAAFQHLRVLHLDQTGFPNLQPLRSLTELRELYLSYTNVEDLEPLRPLTKLEVLDLTGTHAGDISPLAELVELRQLSLTSTPVSELKPLAALKKLTVLDLGNLLVEDISLLAELVQLEELQIFNTKVTNLNPLQNLHKLRLLSCADLMISDLSPLRDMHDLEWLDIMGTQVESLAPLLGLKKLNTVVTMGSLVEEEEILLFKESHPDCAVHAHWHLIY